MRDRLIDATLLIALAAAAAGVGWTLLSLGRSPSRATVDPPGMGGEAPVDAGIVPLTLDDDGSPPAVEAVAPDAFGDRPDSDAAAAVPAVEDASGAPPVATDGPIDLQRIGFSFATGGSGACGVILEPWLHVAVSRELLASFGCGAEVRIVLDDAIGGRTEFDAVIGDTMNPVHSGTVNVYVGADEPALEYGVTSGRLVP